MDQAVPARSDGRAGALERLAGRHGADLVLSGRLRATSQGLTVTIELYVGDRTFADAPEYVGLHTIGRTEPADVFGRNVQLNDDLAEAALHYVKGVVEVARGLGEYSLDDLDGAEARFTAAEQEFSGAERAVAGRMHGLEVVHLMLGNVVGRAGSDRLAEAAEVAHREALDLLGRIGPARPGNLVRRRVFLCNLRLVYNISGDTARTREVDARLSALDRELGRTGPPAGQPQPNVGAPPCG